MLMFQEIDSSRRNEIIMNTGMNSVWALLAVVTLAAAPRAHAVPDVDFDQGVRASGLLETAREGARTAPDSAAPTPRVPAVAAFSTSADNTYTEKEILQAISDLGGNISGGVADIIATVFQKAGRPSGVIVGSEAQGAFIVGYRQGSGKVSFKSSGSTRAKKITWRAPSLGFNVGASVNKVTVLVYNTDDYERLMQTFVSIQGSYHFVAGGGITYLREDLSGDKGKINLAHVAIGLGFDAGVAVEGLTFRKD